MKHLLIGLFFVVTTTLSAINLYGIVKDDYAKYTLESACVTELVSYGTPRKAIITKDGTCSIDINKMH